MAKILLVGEDFHLLATRAAVLSKISAEVTCCSPREFATHVGDDDYALVVLCHSLSVDTASSVAEQARRRWADARLLQLISFQGQPSVDYEVDVVTSSDPGKLLDRVSRLLSRCKDR